MRVVDRLDQLQKELERFRDEYCADCQEFDCGECRRQIGEQDESII